MAPSRKKHRRNHPCESVFTAPQLPHEIIVEILSRLPVKSLFRCVSKLWLSTISSHQFAKTHLDLAFKNNTQKQILLDFADGAVWSIDWESINADDATMNKGLVAVELDNSLKDNPCLWNFVDILSSTNGLVCVVDSHRKTLLVMNPSTGESRKIPVGSQNYRNWCTLKHGFGYASSSDDYKLVRIDGQNIGMYSLRSGSWSKSTTPQMPYHIFWGSNGVPLNGALHWVGRLGYDDGGGRNCVVVCFDLNENTIREMPAPLLDYDSIYAMSLGVINGCLCAHYRTNSGERFWVMREYNNGKSWTMISSGSVRLAKKRDNILRKVRRKIILCNFENGTRGIPTEGKFELGSYMESLISPNHYVGN